jgi:hypothetical protein
MKGYLDKAAAIIDLHERGFSEDFKIVGDRILWIQRKLFFRQKDLSLLAAYHFIERDGTELLILGVSLLPHFAAGIIMWQFTPASGRTHTIINNKIKELLVDVPGFSTHANRTEVCKLHLQ